MRKNEIKPGVVYAYQRSRGSIYTDPEPVVFLNAPADGQMYSGRGQYERKGQQLAFTWAGPRAKPRRGAWSDGDTGYPAVMIYRHDGDEATAESLLAVTLADFEATTQTTVKGIAYTVITSLTPILGPWDEVIAEREARKAAEREKNQREARERYASNVRADAAIAALAQAGVEAQRDNPYGTARALHIPLDEAEKLIALLGAKNSQED